MHDVLIVGAGIIGSFIAWELSKYNLDVIILEKSNDVANETTMSNSAIIHSGYDPEPNTLKAKLNVEGNRLYPVICKELNITLKEIGSITVATEQEQINTLNELISRGEQNGVKVKLLNKEEIKKMEPNISNKVIAGLYASSTYIIFPWELCLALIDHAIQNGLTLDLNTEVTNIESKENYFKITTNKKEYQSKIIINCAGLNTDSINNMVCKTKILITPKRGEYYVLDKCLDGLVNHIIFPIPTEKGKGVLAVPTVHHNILLGPTSSYIGDKEDKSTTKEGLEYIRKEIAKVININEVSEVIRSFSGIRASLESKDFLIESDTEFKNFINVAGIDSPGLASAPAIAKYVVNIVRGITPLSPKIKHSKYEPTTLLCPLNKEELMNRMEDDKNYRKVICRCENITKGEIIASIKGNVGARSIQGVKKRVRPGSGRCQGGFCQSEVVKILSSQLKIKPNEVNYGPLNSNILIEETKRGNG